MLHLKRCGLLSKPSQFVRLRHFSNCNGPSKIASFAIPGGGKFPTSMKGYQELEYGVTPLNNQGIIHVYGKEATQFLQGLLTNDIRQLTPNLANYSCMLSPKGRYLFDIMISQYNHSNNNNNSNNDTNNHYLIECQQSQINKLINHFNQFKLRAKVQFEDFSQKYRIWSVLLPGSFMFIFVFWFYFLVCFCAISQFHTKLNKKNKKKIITKKVKNV